MNPVTEDPVVDEIRTVRRQLQEQFGDDIDALCDYLAQRESEHADRFVRRPSKSPQRVAQGASRK
jgi:hypothetical protein